MSGGLPRGVIAVLRLLLPCDLFEPIAGDLLEDYQRARRRAGLRADLWVWGEAIRVAATFRWERFVHGRGVPPIAEELREVHSVWEAFRRDVMFSLRMLRRQPGFTAVALLALALGIGANTAIFSIVDAVLWRPLPYPHADRVMALAEQRPLESQWFGPVAPADYFDWRRDNRSFSAMAAYMTIPGAYNLTGNGEPERVRPLEVSPAFLSVMGVTPAFGRDFRAEEETVGRQRVVLLSDPFWRRRFGADPSVVGRTVAFDGNAFEIVGVLPVHFWWPTHPDVVVPLALDDGDRALRGAHFLDVIGRLRDNVSPAQAREDLGIIGGRLSQAYPAENAHHEPNLRSLRDALVGDVRTALLVLLGAVGFVLLIACANVATLLLARASGRQKELSVRRAVGATRGHLVRQMLTESVVLGLGGGGAGVLVAAWSLSAFRTLIPAQFAGLPGVDRVAIDMRVLTAALMLSVITSLVFGVVPALVASDQRVGVTLNGETRGSTGTVRARQLRSALVVAELALSLVLLVGAALLIVSFYHLINVSPGFRPAQLVITRVTLPSARYREHARTVAFFDALYERVRGTPGVQRIAATTSLPFDGPDSFLDLTIEHRSAQSPFPVRAHPRIVSTEYFQTMSIPLVRGRLFTDHDTESSGDVVVIDDAAARRYWPNEDPVGQRISLGATSEWREIVGIVSDTRHEGLDADAEPAAFLPQRQRFFDLGTGFERTITLVIRTSSDAASLTSLLRASVASIDPYLPIGIVRPMDDLIGDSVAPQRFNLLLVAAFAVVALVLTAAGLYGVMGYLVSQRTHEIGVRMALGAQPRQVFALVLGHAGAMTLVGIVAGILAALGLTRSMRSLLFGVSAADRAVYVVVSLLLAVVALAAAAVPASRATRVDPIDALREP